MKGSKSAQIRLDAWVVLFVGLPRQLFVLGGRCFSSICVARGDLDGEMVNGCYNVDSSGEGIGV